MIQDSLASTYFTKCSSTNNFQWLKVLYIQFGPFEPQKLCLLDCVLQPLFMLLHMQNVKTMHIKISPHKFYEPLKKTIMEKEAYIGKLT